MKLGDRIIFLTGTAPRHGRHHNAVPQLKIANR
jgi:hypothetical protein